MSFLFAHRRGYGVVPAAGRGTFPPSADGESSLLRFSEKLSARKGRTRLRQFARPGFPVKKRSRPVRANTLTQFAHPGFPVQRKEPPRQGRTRLRQFEHPAQPVQKIREIPKKFSLPKRQQKTPILTLRKRLFG